MTDLNSRSSLTDLIAAIVVALVLVVFLVGSTQLSGRSAMFPRYVAGAAVPFALINIALRAIRLAPGRPSMRVEPGLLLAFVWPVLSVALVFVVGFYVGVPLFMALFFLGRKSAGLVSGAAVIVGFAVLSYLLFGVLLEVRLYPGIFGLGMR